MGRRRRRVPRVFRRALPKVYSCPRCGIISVRVSMREGNLARVACGSCGLSHEHQLTTRKEPIDMYNQFVDAFAAGKIGA